MAKNHHLLSSKRHCKPVPECTKVVRYCTSALKMGQLAIVKSKKNWCSAKDRDKESTQKNRPKKGSAKPKKSSFAPDERLELSTLGYSS